MNTNDFNKYTIPELQELLCDIDQIEDISMKITDINGLCEEINRKHEPNSKMTMKCNEKFKIIMNICDDIEETINNRLNRYGIDEDNIDRIENKIERTLKRKICEELKNRMKNDCEICKYTMEYVEQYFQIYDMTKKMNDVVGHIIGWIEIMKDSE